MKKLLALFLALVMVFALLVPAVGAEEAPQEAEQIDRLQEYVESAAGKVINKIIFGMKSRLSDQAFRECIEAMGEVFQE